MLPGNVGGSGRSTARDLEARWADPVLLPTSLAPLYKKLLALYDLRLDADYRALPIGLPQAHEGLFTVGEVLQLITQHKIL